MSGAIEAGSIIVRLLADASQYMTTMAAGSKAAGAMGTDMAVVGRKMDATGKKMTRAITIPALVLAGAAAKFTLDFEKTMTNAEALVGMTADQVARAKEEILNLSPELGKGPRELGEAFYFIASSGLQGEAAMRALEASATAAAAGLGKTMTVADAVTSVLNAYGEANISATKAVDILTAAVREGKSEPEEFAGSIGRVIPLASKMGMEFGEVAGMMAAMSLTGTDANEAVTQISAILSTAIKPTKEGAAALGSVGESYASLRKRIADEGLLPAIEHLNKAFDGDIEKTAEVFGNIRALRGMLALTGPEAAKYAGIIDRVSAAHGDAAKAAEIALSKPGARIEKAWASVQASLIRAGDIIVPIIADIADEVAEAAEWFGSLDEGSQKAVLTFAALAAAGGPVLSVVGKTTKAVAALNVALTGMRTAGAAGAAAGAGGAAAGVGALAAPIALVTAAIIGAGGLVYALSKLDAASTGAAEANDKLDAAMAAMAADTDGKLQAWADKALGGHFVSNEGQIVWQPAIKVETGEQAGAAVDQWATTYTEKAQAAADKSVQALKDKLAQAEAYRAMIEQQQRRLEDGGLGGMSGPGGSGGADSTLARIEELDRAMAAATSTADSLGAKIDDAMSLGAGQVSIARLKDLRTEQAKWQAELDRLNKIPAEKRTQKVSLDTAAARKKLKQLNDEITKESKKNHTVRIEAETENSKKKLKVVQEALSDLHKQKPTPRVLADIKNFEAKEKRLLAKIKRLDAQVANPKVVLDDKATAQAEAVRQELERTYANAITQTIQIRIRKGQLPERAAGGPTVSGMTYLVGERGPELFTSPTDGRIIPNHELGAVRSETNSTSQAAAQVVNNWTVNIDGYNKGVDEIMAELEAYERRAGRGV